MTTVILSPHLDDAVFSLTEHMLTLTGPFVVTTVFSEGNPIRNDENARALRLVGAQLADLGFKDNPDRVALPPDLTPALIDATRCADQLLVPLGIRHQDHVLVSDVATRHLRDRIIGFYEELPYRVMYPDDRAARVAELADTFPTLEVDSCGGRLPAKRSAVAAYSTQLGEDVQRCVYAPERVWWVR